MVVTEQHCIYCFDVLQGHFDPKHTATANFNDDAYPLFVTWKILNEDEDEDGSQLRGCIGNFSAQSLHSGLREYALTSALRDRRFSPISRRELPYLTCAVSLLTDFTLGDHYLDWEIGTHGIWIEFKDDHGHRRTATFLPEIAAEQGWTKEKTICSLLRKGGYRGKVTAEKCASIKLTRYYSKKFSLTYEQYLAHCAERDHAAHSNLNAKSVISNSSSNIGAVLIDSKDNDNALKKANQTELIKQQA
ncbi:AMMECR1 domain-containing protein [Syncephalis fuscata]|nr:AMMECR1 domain-containing protein [Syncephalis fuscata]